MDKRLAMVVLAISLTVTGCGRETAAPRSLLEKQISDLQAENTRLRKQVEDLGTEIGDLRKQSQTSSSVIPGTIKISREEAAEIALGTTQNVEVKASRLVEFMLFNPQRWVAVWVLDLVSADKRPQGAVIIDANTGQVLSSSNPPTGT